MNDPRSEYERRMNRVLDHIDRNLDAQLDLPGLLPSAGALSPVKARVELLLDLLAD